MMNGRLPHSKNVMAMEPNSQTSHVGPAAAMIIIGAACVVAGGIIAAITGPLELDQGSWLAAYIVLVCGVAQFAIGTVQLAHGRGTAPMPSGRGWTQLVCLNVGNAAVIAGTLTREPLVVDGGAVLLIVAYVIALHAVRPRATHSVGNLAGLPSDGWASQLLIWVYRVFLVLLVISLFIGSVLAHVRAA